MDTERHFKYQPYTESPQSGVAEWFKAAYLRKTEISWLSPRRFGFLPSELFGAPLSYKRCVLVSVETMPRPVSKGSDYDYSEVDGTAYVVLKAELEFIWASFASKIHSLGPFLVFDLEHGQQQPRRIQHGRRRFGGSSLFNFDRRRRLLLPPTRQNFPVNKLKSTTFGRARRSSAALAMLIYVAATNVMEPPPNHCGFVVNNYAVWEEQGEGFRTFDETSKVGPGFALPYLRPRLRPSRGRSIFSRTLRSRGTCCLRPTAGAGCHDTSTTRSAPRSSLSPTRTFLA